MRNKEIKVIDEKKLINLFEVISWLDDKRWKPGSNPGAFDVFIKTIEDLQPAQQILAHWLIYITNRGKDADALWENNSPIIKGLVKDYSECKSVDDVRECVKSLYDGDKKIRAYPADVKSIWRTLVILLDESYQKNIIRFMTEKMSEWGTENFCSKVAFRLYLLSYRDIGKPKKEEVKELLNGGKRGEDALNKIKEAKAILEDGSEFEKEYGKWNRSDRRWHKRLWAALRDYKKHETLSEIFIKGIKGKANREVWRKDFYGQLELPGDRWNEKFSEHLIDPIRKDLNVNGKAPKVIRNLWERVKNRCQKSYPEQFDVSFDLAPRMCEKRLCKVCPFGEDGAKSICKPGGTYCTVALVTCGYLVGCKKEGCVIKGEVGKGICQGRK